MDPIIQKRLLTQFTIYPYIGVVNGDRVFGEAYKMNGYIHYRDRVVYLPRGSEYQIYGIIYFDGEVPTPDLKAKVVGFLDIYDCCQLYTPDQFNYFINSEDLSGRFQLSTGDIVQFCNIKLEDEIIVPGQGRLPIKSCKSYQGLVHGTELVEVVV